MKLPETRQTSEQLRFHSTFCALLIIYITPVTERTYHGVEREKGCYCDHIVNKYATKATLPEHARKIINAEYATKAALEIGSL